MDDRISQLLKKPTLTPYEVKEIIPGSNNKIYGALKRGEIEAFKMGKDWHIPTAPLRRKLGLEAA